jgi:hypothetical protein
VLVKNLKPRFKWTNFLMVNEIIINLNEDEESEDDSEIDDESEEEFSDHDLSGVEELPQDDTPTYTNW